VTTRSLLAAFAVLAAVVLSFAPVSALGPLYGTLSGPDALAPAQVSAYNLTIAGGPTGAVTYTVRWYITGPTPAGGLPTSASPTTLTGNRTTFRLNVTAPQAEQTITLTVKISASVGSTVENTSVQKSVVVITPVILSATFTNTGSTAAVNVTVRFYVDGALVGTETISRLNPGGSITETFRYLPANLQPGTHQVRVEADLDGNGVIDPARGEVVVSSLFYRGTPSLSTGWTVLIGIAVFLPVLIVTVGLRRRQRT
jgi:CARDB